MQIERCRCALPGKGMPILGAGGRRGDHACDPHCRDAAATCRNAQEELLRELAELEHKNVSPQRKSFFEKLSELFTGTEAEAKEKK